MYKDRINLVLDGDISEAAERAATFQRKTKTAYIREALITQLAKDGFRLAPNDNCLPVPVVMSDNPNVKVSK